VRQGLEETGNYEVRVENDATRGLAAAREFRPDLIILDVIMPDVDGGELAAAIRTDTALKDTPLLFLSSVMDAETAAKRGNRIGTTPVLTKPTTLAELTGRVEQLLNS
jgi:DNA-binding response OmpR family regulator